MALPRFIMLQRQTYTANPCRVAEDVRDYCPESTILLFAAMPEAAAMSQAVQQISKRCCNTTYPWSLYRFEHLQCEHLQGTLLERSAAILKLFKFRPRPSHLLPQHHKVAL